MRVRHLLAAVLISLVTIACDREPDEPKKPATPPPNPNPVPAVPQASAASASQPKIVPTPATQQRGPETPAVGSVKQPPIKPGGDANPTVTTPATPGATPGNR
jgi:hypothetical protein